MGSRSRGRAPTAAVDAEIEHPESGVSGKENVLKQQWIRLGPELGPSCRLCRTWLATRHHQDFGAICINCKKTTDGNLITWYWGMLRGPNGIAAYVRPAGDRKDGYATETSSKLEYDSAG